FRSPPERSCSTSRSPAACSAASASSRSAPLRLGPFCLRTRRRDMTMANLIYSAITSLDGYVADEQGKFDWSAPDEEVHAFVNELERTVGTYLYGRRMYEVMSYWETADA